MPDFMPTRSTPVAAQPDWSSAPPPASSAPSWASDEVDPIESAPVRTASSAPSAPDRERLAAVVPIRREDRGPAASATTGGIGGPPAVDEIIDDPDAISDDDEDIEASGEVGLAVVERLLGGTVISEDEDA